MGPPTRRRSACPRKVPAQKRGFSAKNWLAKEYEATRAQCNKDLDRLIEENSGSDIDLANADLNRLRARVCAAKPKFESLIEMASLPEFDMQGCTEFTEC